jgi:hypothetical protein
MENGQLTWITNFIWGIADGRVKSLCRVKTSS